MYSAEVISLLEERISWSNPLDTGFAIGLATASSTGTSGKNFKSYHQMVTVENIYDCTSVVDMEEDPFNELLLDFRKQAVLKCLTDIVDTNISSDPNVDYSNLIENNISIFDDAIGFKVAVGVLEMLMSTSRMNLIERNAKASASNLKLELEGFRNENGHTVAKGIKYYYNEAVRKASLKLFPKDIIVKAGPLW